MARPAGFEPTTLGFGGQYSDPLSYGRFQVKIIPLSHPGTKPSMSSADHDQHSSFIKTPQQLLVVILLSFLVPIIGIILLVQLVLSTPSMDPGALAPEKVAERIQPVGRVELGAAPAAAGARTGDEIVKSV